MPVELKVIDVILYGRYDAVTTLASEGLARSNDSFLNAVTVGFERREAVVVSFGARASPHFYD